MKSEANSKALKWVHRELKGAEINKERAIKRHDDNAVADLENKIYILKYLAGLIAYEGVKNYYEGTMY